MEAITVKEIVEATEIQRIYMMFISPEEAYLNGMASREQFATLYKFILQRKRSKSTFPPIEGGKLLKYPRKIINFHDTGVF